MENKALEYFQTIPTDVLAAITRGEIDPVKLAGEELASRGLNEHGGWVGVDAAHQLQAAKFKTSAKG